MTSRKNACRRLQDRIPSLRNGGSGSQPRRSAGVESPLVRRPGEEYPARVDHDRDLEFPRQPVRSGQPAAHHEPSVVSPTDKLAVDGRIDRVFGLTIAFVVLRWPQLARPVGLCFLGLAATWILSLIATVAGAFASNNLIGGSLLLVGAAINFVVSFSIFSFYFYLGRRSLVIDRDYRQIVAEDEAEVETTRRVVGWMTLVFAVIYTIWLVGSSVWTSYQNFRTMSSTLGTAVDTAREAAQRGVHQSPQDDGTDLSLHFFGLRQAPGQHRQQGRQALAELAGRDPALHRARGDALQQVQARRALGQPDQQGDS